MNLNTSSIESFKTFNGYVGKSVLLYTDVMNKEGLLGEGVILLFLEEPNAKQTFIRKEMPSDKQEVWAPRKCKVQVSKITRLGESFNLVLGEPCIREIAHPYRKGITSSKYKLIKPIPKYPRIRMDNFEIIKGWGQCF